MNFKDILYYLREWANKKKKKWRILEATQNNFD